VGAILVSALGTRIPGALSPPGLECPHHGIPLPMPVRENACVLSGGIRCAAAVQKCQGCVSRAGRGEQEATVAPDGCLLLFFGCAVWLNLIYYLLC